MDNAECQKFVERALNILGILNKISCGASIHKIANYRSVALSIIDLCSKNEITAETAELVLSNIEHSTANLLRARYFT